MGSRPLVAPLCFYCRRRESFGRLDGEEVCFDCVEDLIERENAVALAPELREILPPIRVWPRVRPRGARPLDDSPELAELRKQWEAYKASAGL